MFETMAAFVLQEHLAQQSFDPPVGPPGDLRLLSPHNKPVKTADGWISFTVNTDPQVRAFLMATERSDLLDDARFAIGRGASKQRGRVVRDPRRSPHKSNHGPMGDEVPQRGYRRAAVSHAADLCRRISTSKKLVSSNTKCIRRKARRRRFARRSASMKSTRHDGLPLNRVGRRRDHYWRRLVMRPQRSRRCFRLVQLTSTSEPRRHERACRILKAILFRIRPGKAEQDASALVRLSLNLFQEQKPA